LPSPTDRSARFTSSTTTSAASVPLRPAGAENERSTERERSSRPRWPPNCRWSPNWSAGFAVGIPTKVPY
jgi:hypothetical protein